jgi:hypothetical protein
MMDKKAVNILEFLASYVSGKEVRGRGYVDRRASSERETGKSGGHRHLSPLTPSFLWAKQTTTNTTVLTDMSGA